MCVCLKLLGPVTPVLQREIRNAEWQLKRQVLFEKRKAVYGSH